MNKTQNADTGTVLDIKDLSVSLMLGGVSFPVVENVTFSLYRGRTLGIVGESGSGKSLLSRSLLKLLPPGSTVSGSVRYTDSQGETEDVLRLSEGQLRRIRGREIGILFQEPAPSMNPVLRVGDQIRDAIQGSLRSDRKASIESVYELLSQVELEDPRKIAESYPHELSGGMLQRVALAAALAGKPTLLIADEPTTALDASLRKKILETLGRLQDQLDLTLILVSHDLNLIAEWTHEVLVMYCGRMVEFSSTETLLASSVHPYTRALLETERSYSGEGLPEAIPGELPSIRNQPSGCRFHPRCTYADENCRLDEPEITKTANGGKVRCFYPL